MPGWNFLRFQKTGIRAYYPWLTEYEKDTNNWKKPPLPHHKNSVYKLVRLELSVNTKGQKFYEKLFGKNLKEEMTLSCGTKLHFKKSRNNGYKRIVLACRDLNRFSKYAKSTEQIIYHNRSAAFIKNPSGGWDIVVMEM